MLTENDQAQLREQMVARAAALNITGTPDRASHDLGFLPLDDGSQLHLFIIHAVDPIITDGTDVVVINRTEFPGKGLPALPGGMIDPTKGGGIESAVRAAAREALEEAGIELDDTNAKLIGTRNMNRPFDIRTAYSDGLAAKYGVRTGDVFMVSTQAVRFDVPDLKNTSLHAGDDAEPGSARRVNIASMKKEDLGIPDHYDMIMEAMAFKTPSAGVQGRAVPSTPANTL